MFNWWGFTPDPPPVMPKLGSRWRRIKDPWRTPTPDDAHIHAITQEDLDFWSHPDRGETRLRAWCFEWEQLFDKPKSLCECGGQHAGGSHSHWCPAHPSGGKPAFKMPDKLSF